MAATPLNAVQSSILRQMDAGWKLCYHVPSRSHRLFLGNRLAEATTVDDVSQDNFLFLRRRRLIAYKVGDALGYFWLTPKGRLAAG